MDRCEYADANVMTASEMLYEEAKEPDMKILGYDMSPPKGVVVSKIKIPFIYSFIQSSISRIHR